MAEGAGGRGGEGCWGSARLGQRDAQELGDFSLDLDDALGGREPLLEPGVLAGEAVDLLGQRIRPAATRRPSQRFEGTALAGPSPVHEVARVEALTAQDGTDATGLGSVDLGEDVELVLGAEASADRTFGDLWVGHGSSMHPPVQRGLRAQHGDFSCFPPSAQM